MASASMRVMVGRAGVCCPDARQGQRRRRGWNLHRPALEGRMPESSRAEGVALNAWLGLASIIPSRDVSETQAQDLRFLERVDQRPS